MPIKLSIVIGALNEEGRLDNSLRKLSLYLTKQKMISTTELVLVIADGSDNTFGVAKKHEKSFKHFVIIQPGPPVGKGRDIQLGIQAAKGPVRLFMDADLATPLHHIEDAVTLIEHKGADIVIGVRDIRKMHHSRTRFFISLLGNLSFSLVTGRYLPDTQCGFKAFSKSSTQICFSRMTRQRWSFDMELLLIAFQHNLHIAQLPIYDWVDVPNGTFSGGLGNSAGFSRDLCIMLWNRLSGKYR